MAEQTWHEARLIPTSGISGADAQERRATSALLAVMGVVKEFSRGPFEVTDGKKVIPDGLIRVPGDSGPVLSACFANAATAAG